MCLVTWPLNESEAGVDLVMIQTSSFSFVNDVVVVLISKNLHKKSNEVSIKTRSTSASLSFIGQVTIAHNCKMNYCCDGRSLNGL